MRACINCSWKGTEEELAHPNHKTCPVCGDYTMETEPVKKEKIVKDAGILDINKDGKVDGRDVTSLIKKIKNKVKSKGKRR